ncbi:MAG: exodeoxyribonuclease VII small subunit [Succinivibrio sp.]
MAVKQTKQMTSLEERLKGLEEITEKLESGELTIDEAIALYSQGMELAVSCKKTLDDLSQKITVARKKAQKAIDDSSDQLSSDDSDDEIEDEEESNGRVGDDLPF